MLTVRAHLAKQAPHSLHVEANALQEALNAAAFVNAMDALQIARTHVGGHRCESEGWCAWEIMSPVGRVCLATEHVRRHQQALHTSLAQTLHQMQAL